jgi:hypothetical protein
VLPVWTWEEWMRTRPVRAALFRAVAASGARLPVNPTQEKLRIRLWVWTGLSEG